jgi:2-oxoglutarate dehydrogenase complex dehydrogenase (E1) component-like enzyme
MYQKIGWHPTVREVWASSLVARGVVTSDQADAIYQARAADMQAAYEALRP